MTLQESLFYAAVVFFALAAIFIIVAAIIFFMRDIRGIRNYLTGKTLREAVERGSSSAGRNRRKAPTSATANTGRTASTSGASGSVEPQSGPIRHVSTVTPAHSSKRVVAEGRSNDDAPKVAAKGASKDGGKGEFEASQEPSGSSADYPSSAGATTILDDGTSATTILGDGVGKTDVLEVANETQSAQAEAVRQDSEDAPATGSQGKTAHEGFAIVRKVVLTASTSFVSAD